MNDTSGRRDFLKLGMAGLATAGVLATVDAQKAAAQAASDSLLRTVLDRGKLIVGTGSTNAPWHFENDAGELVGMDITMGRILAKGLFDDPTKVEFVMQDPAQRIPNVTTNKVDITIQFMTMSAQRSQLINFSRPYYVEGVALLTLPTAENKTFDKLLAGWCGDARFHPAERRCGRHRCTSLCRSAQVMQIDTQANVLQALESKRVDAAAVDLSTVRWLASRNPDKYFDAGKSWYLDALRRSAPARRSRLADLRQSRPSPSPCSATRRRSTMPPSRIISDRSRRPAIRVSRSSDRAAEGRHSAPFRRSSPDGPSRLRRTHGLCPQLQPDLAKFRQAVGRAAAQPRTGRHLDRHRHRHRPGSGGLVCLGRARGAGSSSPPMSNSSAMCR